MRIRWRKWNTVIHRDLGYICFGLTVIYAISGLAVNHIADWNPSYRIERLTTTMQLQEGLSAADLVPSILQGLDETGKYKNSFQPDPNTLKIFVEGNTLTVNLKTGLIDQEKVTKRPGLFEVNFLHLNHPKKMWTIFADLYAIALLLLAITGLFILPGKKGIKGRGAWLTTLGVLLPIFFVWLYG